VSPKTRNSSRVYRHSGLDYQMHSAPRPERGGVYSDKAPPPPRLICTLTQRIVNYHAASIDKHRPRRAYLPYRGYFYQSTAPVYSAADRKSPHAGTRAIARVIAHPPLPRSRWDDDEGAPSRPSFPQTTELAPQLLESAAAHGCSRSILDRYSIGASKAFGNARVCVFVQTADSPGPSDVKTHTLDNVIG